VYIILKDLENKVAIITGSARGIGKAIALRLAKSGAHIVITDIMEDVMKETLTEVQEISSESIAIKADVTNKEQIDALVKQVMEKWGKIDILVNNAGLTKDKSFTNMTEDMWDLVLNVNLKGMFFTSQAVLREMKARAKSAPEKLASFGKIINIASNSADGNFGQANYAASKAGVIGLTKTLAIEFARYNIQCNTVKPGFILTPMTKIMPQPVLDAKIKDIPMGRLGEAEEVANVVYFYASSLSNYVTGTVLSVDGGERTQS
jgi:3-oxoacyl-[acyl-carrier protein] reductase